MIPLLFFLSPSLVLASSWTLTSKNFNQSTFQIQPFVANGYISQRIPVEGMGHSEIRPIDADHFIGTNGYPLFNTRFTAAVVAGFYDHQENVTVSGGPQDGGQQPISTIPTWSSLYITIANQTYGPNISASQVSDWSQTLSIQDGVVTTSLTWTPLGRTGKGLSLKYTIFAHRTKANLGVVRLDVSGLKKGETIQVTDVLDGAGTWRTTPVSAGMLNSSNAGTSIIHSSVSPVGIPYVSAHLTSLFAFESASLTTTITPGSTCLGPSSLSNTSSTASVCHQLHAPSSGSFSAVKYVGIASSDAFPGSELSTALSTSLSAYKAGFSSLLKSHSDAWDALWDDADIIIPGDSVEEKEVQLAARASLFYVLTNMREGHEGAGLGDTSVSPVGLSSDSYAGLIFWDAETWIAPGLLALHPTYAESVANFRYKQLSAAYDNAKFYNYTLPGQKTALYPWTSGRWGNCTGVGPCVTYEYHINVDVTLFQLQYFLSTHNTTWLAKKAWPVLEGVANWLTTFVTHNAETNTYHSNYETDPDEYWRFIDDGAFTNAAIAKTLTETVQYGKEVLGIEAPKKWSEIANGMKIWQDSTSGITLEFANYNNTPIKQADVTLLTYPLEYPYKSVATARQDLDFYSTITDPGGPGMTYSISSIAASTLDESGCQSWTYLLSASQPYSRAPFYQFSEQQVDDVPGVDPAFTFLTGHGGFLQTFTHGFTGYRSRLHTFYLDPTLPPQLKEYTLKGMKWGSSTFDVKLSRDQTTVYRRKGGKELVTVEIKGRGNYTLATGHSLTVPTRLTRGTLVPSNLAQCASILPPSNGISDTSFNPLNNTPSIVPGHYALAAVDGSNATSWQPATDTLTSFILDLGSSKPFRNLHFNWGARPPKRFIFAAGTSQSSLKTVTSGNVNVTAPFDKARALAVEIRLGNTTDVQLDRAVKARYVQVSIEGNFEGDGKGATLAELAVIES